MRPLGRDESQWWMRRLKGDGRQQVIKHLVRKGWVSAVSEAYSMSRVNVSSCCIFSGGGWDSAESGGGLRPMQAWC